MPRVRQSWLLAIACLAILAVGVGAWTVWFRAAGDLPVARPVPAGDQEIAWIHNTTGGDAWALFVIGLKRAEMATDGRPSELAVDDANAFPPGTTAVPEVIVSRVGCAGKLRFRWYKVSAENSVEEWIAALAARAPAPLAVVGGSTSDRAHELALALNRRVDWHGDRPLLLITTATVDTVLADPDNPSGFARVPDQRNLVEVYRDRSFRFCFSNSQMVQAVSDFVLQEPTLQPGPTGWPALRAVGEGAAGPWPTLANLADLARKPTVFPLEWQDDPYSGDLYNQFREHLHRTLGGATPASAPRIVREPTFSIPFSVGGFSRANPGEAAAVRAVIEKLPPPGERSLLVLPSGSSAPARRVLLALAERVPQSGRRLVAVTGDGLSVNTFYRDAEWAWPARSIPIPLVCFAHFNPFGWDAADDPTPPRGYRLEPNTSTEEVLLDNTLARMLCEAVLRQSTSGSSPIESRADAVATRFRERADEYFDERGNRRGRRGEHVVVIRPTVRYGATAPGPPRPDSVIEVYRRAEAGRDWVRVGAVPVLPERLLDRSASE